MAMTYNIDGVKMGLDSWIGPSIATSHGNERIFTFRGNKTINTSAKTQHWVALVGSGVIA